MIAQDPYWAYEYARDVIEGRFPAGEPVIMKDRKYASWYAQGVIKGPWPEAGIK